MSSMLSAHADALRTRGFTVIPDVWSPAQIAASRAALDDVFRREAAVAAERGWRNDRYHVSYMLAAKHPQFVTAFQHDTLLALMRTMLGARCQLSSLNGFAMVPGGRAQALHIDQRESAGDTVLGLNTVHPLDDFTCANGATRLVPGSHRRPWTGQADDIDAAETDAIQIEATAGSVIVYNAAVWHAGSRNATTQPRRSLHAFFVREWVRPDWDFPRSLPAHVAATLTPDQRQLLGFDAGPSRYDLAAQREVVGHAATPPPRWRRWFTAAPPREPRA